MALGIARGAERPLSGAGRIAGRAQMHRELPGQAGHLRIREGQLSRSEQAVRPRQPLMQVNTDLITELNRTAAPAITDSAVCRRRRRP